MTLPRVKRISRASFPKTKGSRAFFEYGSVSFSPELPSSGAVVVSKKAFKTSVTRHKVKRRVLSALRGALRMRGAVIIYPNAAAITARFKNLQESLEKTLGKLSSKT